MRIKNVSNLRKIGLSLVCLLFLVTGAFAQDGVVDFESDAWQLQNGEVVQHMGRKCLVGSAMLKDVQFENGIIEMDIAVTGERSYPGIYFRVQSMKNFEHFYIRPHRVGLYPDALQYCPTINGIGSWQLYNGKGKTAPTNNIPQDQWVHVKMEIHGSQARVFINNAEEPALVIDHLYHGAGKGGIGLNGPMGSPDTRTAYFSNFKYKIDNNLEFDPAPVIKTPLGMITQWELSQAFKAGNVDIKRLPAEQGITGIEWQKVSAEPSGLVNIARFIKNRGRTPDCVFARTIINSDKDDVKHLRFGYSDTIAIFLNGRILFSANSGYTTRDPSFLGIVGLNDSIYLPLKKGKNELLLVIAESFGGWGFMFRDGETVFQHESITKLWELPGKIIYPESVLYDKKRDILYVSNYANDSGELISRVKTNGEIETLKWITGIPMPTGMCIYNDKLFVVGREGLVEINIDAGKITKTYPVPGAQFINDVAFDAAGNAYISDSNRGAVYKLSNGKTEVWLEGGEIQDPNGLHVDNDKLIVGNSGDGCLKAVNLSDKKVRTIACLDGQSPIVDGIKPDGKGNYIVSDFRGNVYLVSPSGRKTELLDTTAPGYFCADFEYIIEKNLLIVPSLFDHRIIAYRYQPK